MNLLYLEYLNELDPILPPQTYAFSKGLPVSAHATYYRDRLYKISEYFNPHGIVRPGNQFTNVDIHYPGAYIINLIKEAHMLGLQRAIRKEEQQIAVAGALITDIFINTLAGVATMVPDRESRLNRERLGWGLYTSRDMLRRMIEVLPGHFSVIKGNSSGLPDFRSATSVVLTEAGIEFCKNMGLMSVFGDMINETRYNIHSKEYDSYSSEIKKANRKIDCCVKSLYMSYPELSNEEIEELHEESYNEINNLQAELEELYNERSLVNRSATKVDIKDSKALETVKKIETVNKVRNKNLAPVKAIKDGREVLIADNLTWHIRINNECAPEEQHKYIYARGFSKFGSEPEEVRLTATIDGESVIGIDMKSSSANHIRMSRGEKPLPDVYAEFVTADISRDLVKDYYQTINCKTLQGAYTTAREMTYEHKVDYKICPEYIKSVVKHFFDNYRPTEDWAWASISTLESLFNIGIHYEFAKLGLTINSVHDQWYIPESKFGLFKEIAARVTKDLYGELESDLHMTKSKLINGEIVEEDFSISI